MLTVIQQMVDAGQCKPQKYADVRGSSAWFMPLLSQLPVQLALHLAVAAVCGCGHLLEEGVRACVCVCACACVWLVPNTDRGSIHPPSGCTSFAHSCSMQVFDGTIPRKYQDAFLARLQRGPMPLLETKPISEQQVGPDEILCYVEVKSVPPSPPPPFSPAAAHALATWLRLLLALRLLPTRQSLACATSADSTVRPSKAGYPCTQTDCFNPQVNKDVIADQGWAEVRSRSLQQCSGLRASSCLVSDHVLRANNKIRS